MIRRPFFSLGRPSLKFPVVQKSSPIDIPLPSKVTLFLKVVPADTEDLALSLGDKVKTGQKLKITENDEDYFISTVSGTICDISEYTGYLGRDYTSISIETVSNDEWDDEFATGKAPTLKVGREFLGCLPGAPDFASLLDFKTPVNTIIIYGIDKDLLVTTNQFIVETEVEALAKGIELLKNITHIDEVIIVVPPHLLEKAGETSADVRKIRPSYPNTLPGMIVKEVLGREISPGKNPVEMGVGIISAEAVVALGNAFDRGEIPVEKTLTIIKKDGTTVLARARIGTPLKDVLETLNIQTAHGDRLVLGGPMTGTAAYSEDLPVLPDTDAVMIQDRKDITPSSDTQCINCGECIRACPTNIPVNMLVRLLENGLYEEAASEYDLLSCIECGLCSYVCTARIPVFHYIMLGKYEYSRIISMEEPNE